MRCFFKLVFSIVKPISHNKILVTSRFFNQNQLNRSRVLVGKITKAAAFIFMVTVCDAVSAGDWAYGSRGWEWGNDETGSFIWTGVRAQLRYSSLEPEPRELSQLLEEPTSKTTVNRARFKLGAGWRDDITFYQEYDLRNSVILDLRTTWNASESTSIRLGQWKSEYNRERIDSSGKQQFVERSIANYWFTIDRQGGVVASGRTAAGSPWDSSWWVGALTGEGRGGSTSGDRPMWLVRYQWNYLGNLLPFSQSALKRYDSPHASLSFAAVNYRGPYTRYSSDGGGQLPGYDAGAEEQYDLEQFMQEWAYQKSGFSWQQEWHWKSIYDRINSQTRKIRGGYAQIGWFPSTKWDAWPERFEVAARIAYVDPDTSVSGHNKEHSLAINWFFAGHRNKLTADISYLEIEDAGVTEDEVRVRLQYDLSL